MRKKLAAALLALVLGLGLCPPAAADGDVPYAIAVNRAMNTVTVYARDADGAYTLPVRAMICSTAKDGRSTPLGEFRLSARKKEWNRMVDNSWAQYTSQITGDILFHSVCYEKKDPATLMTEEYNLLGSPASLGCVRLQVADSKWIFDNCPAGTPVTIYDGDDPGPLGKPPRVLPEITPELDNGWEPTDPNGENPWLARYAKNITLDRSFLALEAGDAAAIVSRLDPVDALLPGVVWTSSDPAVAAVSGTGRVTALSAGTAVITAACGEKRASATVAVTGELLPFADVPAGAWYYGDLRITTGRGLLGGTDDRDFSPSAAVSRAMAVQVLYNLALSEGAAKAGPEGAEWWSAALRWARESGVAAGMTEEFIPNRPVTRQELAMLLYRYETLIRGKTPQGFADLGRYADAGAVFAFAETAVVWAVGNQIIEGDGETTLSPTAPLTRAQLAAVLSRYI